MGNKSTTKNVQKGLSVRPKLALGDLTNNGQQSTIKNVGKEKNCILTEKPKSKNSSTKKSVKAVPTKKPQYCFNMQGM